MYSENFVFLEISWIWLLETPQRTPPDAFIRSPISQAASSEAKEYNNRSDLLGLREPAA
jgi:hypothetical protein